MLITGGSGFTGMHACRYFHNAGFEVTAVSRKNSCSKDVDWYTEQCDLLERKDVNRLLRKLCPDYVLHLAAQNHVGKSWADPVLSVESNVLGTLYLLEALRQINPACKIIVLGSALQFNPNNISELPHPYSLSKSLQVLVAQAWETLFGMNIVIAKPSNLIGPGYSNGVCSVFAQKIVEMERKIGNNVLEVSNLNARRDFLDVRDAVRGYHFLFNYANAGEIYEIATGNTLSLEEVINKFKLYSNAEFTISSKEVCEEDIVRGCPDKIIKLGWQPLISYDESLSCILNFYRKLNEDYI